MVLKMREERVRIGKLPMHGDLVVPAQPLGFVVFAHGLDRGCHCEPSRSAASVLERLRLATLLLDLTAGAETTENEPCSDAGLLGQRLEQVLDWLTGRPDLAGLSVGLFGTCAGAAAALWTAAMNPNRIAAIVSRGGRTDLVAPYLPRVEAPTLLIVGGADAEIGRLNRSALAMLHCNKRLEVVPGATLMHDEPAALETVAHLAGNWFLTHLSRQRMS